MTLAEMLDKLERGKIGHGEAMRWLGTDSLIKLVATVHANGRQMPGHRPHAISAETRAVLMSVTRKVPARGEPSCVARIALCDAGLRLGRAASRLP